MSNNVNFLEEPSQAFNSNTNMRYDLYGRLVQDSAGFTAGIIPTRPTDNNVTDGMYVPPYVHCVSFASVPEQVSKQPYLSDSMAWTSQNSSQGGQGNNQGGPNSNGFYDDMFYSTVNQTQSAVTTSTPSTTLPPITVGGNSFPGADPLPGSLSQVTNSSVPQQVSVLDSTKQ